MSIEQHEVSSKDLLSHCAKCGKPEEMERMEPGGTLLSKRWRTRDWLSSPDAKVPEVRDICHDCFVSFGGDEDALLTFLKNTPISPSWARWQQEEAHRFQLN